ncbi:hypothetical protein [Cytobacillus praedii]|uniref:hypothetical protein n=1 Tax=Cytobacillus praedii TaxID=1742358 RepID=UPI002E20F6A0|nr:hypothetical protein [Cytobacillus praedii]
MAKIQRLYDFQNGTRTDAEQVDAEFDNLVKAHNDQDDEVQKKLSVDGDFKGTWNGHEFEEADPFLSSRITAMENMVKEEDKVTVTLKRGENTIEALEHAALVPVEILGDEVKNLALDFDHWTLHLNTVKNSPDKVTLNAASAKEVSSIKVEIKRNQDYVYSMKHTGAIAVLDSTMSETVVVAYTADQFIKFNSGNHSTIHLAFKNKNDEPGTFTFEGPMLIEGTVEREFVQNYQPVRGPYIEVNNGSYLYFDEYLYKGDKLYQDGQGNWRKKQNRIECELTADTVKNPTINSSYTGGKAIKIPLSNFAKGIDIYDVEVIKFNNSYFTRTDSAANIINNRYYLDNDSLILFVSATDTGWQDDPAPPAEGQPTPEPLPSKLEIMAFILGWKMAHTDGTTPYVDANKGTKGAKKWIRLIGTGESLILPTVSYNGWKPFKIIYKTTSEQDVSAKYEGDLRLVKGINKVFLGEGIVLREKATPVLSGDKYYIGSSSANGSETRYSPEKVIEVVKSGKHDNWTLGVDAQLDKPLYDTLGFYGVTYKVKDKFSFSCYIGQTEAKHTVNFHMENNKQVQEIEEMKRKLSQFGITVIDKIGKIGGPSILGNEGIPLMANGVRSDNAYEVVRWFENGTGTNIPKGTVYEKRIPIKVVPESIRYLIGRGETVEAINNPTEIWGSVSRTTTNLYKRYFQTYDLIIEYKGFNIDVSNITPLTNAFAPLTGNNTSIGTSLNLVFVGFDFSTNEILLKIKNSDASLDRKPQIMLMMEVYGKWR